MSNFPIPQTPSPGRGRPFETSQSLVEKNLKSVIKLIGELREVMEKEVPSLRATLSLPTTTLSERLDIMKAITEMMRTLTTAMQQAAKILTPSSGGDDGGDLTPEGLESLLMKGGKK